MGSVFKTFVIDRNGTVISCCKLKANFTRHVTAPGTALLCHLHFPQELYLQPKARAATEKWLVAPAAGNCFTSALYTANRLQEQVKEGKRISCFYKDGGLMGGSKRSHG